MSEAETLRPRLDRFRSLALVVGGVGLAACVAMALLRPDSFFPAYLVGYLFWLDIALGSLALTMLHHLVGGSWGMVIRRPLEAGAMALLPMALFFLPVLAGLPHLYPWARPGGLHETGPPGHERSAERSPLATPSQGLPPSLAATSPVVGPTPPSSPSAEGHADGAYTKADYLKPGAFMIRAAIYFLIWVLLALLLNRWSAEQDRTEDPSPSERLARLSAPGLVIFFLSVSFAAIDWAMSLEPAWYSTIYGARLMVSQGLATFALMITVAALLARGGDEAMSAAASPARLNDLGNLMLAFVMLWAYTSFSQYLIIWCGNLSEEIPWYLRRTRGGWQWVGIALMIFHFFLPFFYLLFRENKRKTETLMGVALAIVVMHLVDLTWLVIPAPLDPAHPHVPWIALAMIPVTIVGIGGIWTWFFLGRLPTKSLVPLHVPGIDLGDEHSGGH